jgi:hypothetical protein
MGTGLEHSGEKRRGATPVWLVCALVCGGAGWLAADLHQSAGAAGFTTVDPARIALDLPAGDLGLPTEWRELVALRLVRLGELSSLDESLSARVTAAVGGLSFVREAGSARVLWPNGLSLPLRLREPVACISLGEEFLPVASDGVVLPGYRSTPPDFGRGLLPVIGPLDRTFLDFRPGDCLLEARHLDALSVAVSMREHLSPGDLEALGPVVIDASRAHLAAVDEAGTRLWLEASRKVLYGRPPSYDAPGELPEADKWRNLMSAIGYLGGQPGAEGRAPLNDWDLVDLRWDVPVLRPRLGYR